MDNNERIETAHVFPGAKIVVIYNDGWAHFTESQADAARAFDAVKLGARLICSKPAVCRDRALKRSSAPLLTGVVRAVAPHRLPEAAAVDPDALALIERS